MSFRGGGIEERQDLVVGDGDGLDQLVACGAKEFGVELRDFNCKGDFVGNALSGAVSAGEKFKIFDAVVGSNAVDMMHGFFRKQFASNVLLHVVSMFINVCASLTVNARESQDHIASHHASKYLALRTWSYFFIGGDKFLTLKSTAARIATSFGAHPTVSRGRKQCRANWTGFLFGLSAAYMRAFKRTIERIFAEFYMVLPKLSGIPEKSSAARLARKLDGLNFVVRAPVLSERRVVTGVGAIFSAVSHLLGRGVEGFCAIFTRKTDELVAKSVKIRVGLAAFIRAKFGIVVSTCEAEFSLAVAASRRSGNEALILASKSSSVLEVAFARAKISVRLFGAYGKNGAAVLARTLDQHVWSLMTVRHLRLYNTYRDMSTVSTLGVM